MEKIMAALNKFDFSKMESNVYIILLKHPQINGSQIAKLMNVPRSSAYLALEGLYKKGAIFLLPGTSNIYQAEEPEKLFERLKQNYNETANMLKNELSKLQKVKDKNNQYMNIEGLNNIKFKIKELIKNAKKEIYIHTNFDLKLFEKELKIAHKNGVRIIMFSFGKLKTDLGFLELYLNPKFDFSESDYQKVFLVIDREKVLISSGQNSEYTGTFSENELLIKLVSDHIHHDIYIHKLEEKSGKNLISGEIQLGTIHEKYCILECGGTLEE